MQKRNLVNFLALLLIAIGITGALIGFGCAYYLSTNGLFSDVKNLETNTIKELEIIALTLRDMNTTALDAAETLQKGKQILENSAQNLNQSAAIFRKVANLMDFELPVTNEKPLAETQAYFNELGKRSEYFSGYLATLSSSFYTDSADIAKLGNDFTIVANNLDNIRLNLERLNASSIYKIVMLALVWVGFLHFTFIIAGVALLLK